MNMRKILTVIGFFLIILASPIRGQEQFRVYGFVRDQLTGEKLIGANIFEQGTTNGTSADYNGYFSLLVRNPSTLQVSFLGYKNYVVNFNPKKDTLVNILLSTSTEQLDEVVVTAQRTPKFNVSTLSYKQMTQLPSLGGKPDIIRSLQLLPGITAQNEGSSLMLVRGGDPGQNLYLFDNVPVIYVNHLGGFMSVFNPDIINNIDVYKGGFPSRYGGKLSSVVDITQREGDKSGLKGSFGIGITDASFSVEGPLKIKNTSFIITGRKTLIDPLIALASRLSGNGYIVFYGFHDLNGKFSWKPNERNNFNLNIYQGDDYLNFWSTKKVSSTEKYRLSNTWGNLLVSARWNSLISSKLYSSNSISYTRYRLKDFMSYSLTSRTDTSAFKRKYLSSVQDISYRSAWKYNASENRIIDFGLQSSLLSFVPNNTYLSNRDVQPPVDRTNSLESALYADNKLTFLTNQEATLGLRIVNYSTRGYTGFSFEPRLNVNIAINDNHTLNASYMRVSQYSHLIFTTGNIMNNEVWVPVNKQIPPAKSDQFTLGWNGGFKNMAYSTEVNLYYKKMYDLTTFKEGYTSLMGDENWRSKIETGGKGDAIGAEFMIRKNTGKWTGFAGYTVSKTTRQYPGINNGREYLFDYNRPHIISLNANYKLNEKLSFNLVWIYQTGLPYTPAIGRQYTPSLEDGVNNIYYYEALIYGERNSANLNAYHRLDFGVSYSKLTRENGNKAILNFSVYNVYNRHNAVYYYYNSNSSPEIYNPENWRVFKPLSLYQMSLFPIIPTISYKVFFDGSSTGKPRQKIPVKEKFNNWLYQKN
jgi:hypothetical protein